MTESTTDTQPVIKELRAAAARPRTTHAALAKHIDIRGSLDLTEWAEWFGTDEVLSLPVVNAWIALMGPNLAEPVAAWLQSAISIYLGHTEDPTYASDHGYRWCTDCNDEECSGLTQVDNALAVARAINGTAS